MTERADRVRDHYQAAIDDRDALLARIGAAVDAMEAPLDARRLASLDQFHMGGLAATIAVAERVGVARDARVLDAGSGLGGPARYLAETFGCHVEGIDLSPDYVAIARMLTARTGLADKVLFQEGDLTRLPFEDARFDLAWTQHVAMNIADRADLYHELRRVLKRGGRLALYDPLATDGHTDLIVRSSRAVRIDQLASHHTRERSPVMRPFPATGIPEEPAVAPADLRLRPGASRFSSSPASDRGILRS